MKASSRCVGRSNRNRNISVAVTLPLHIMFGTQMCRIFVGHRNVVACTPARSLLFGSDIVHFLVRKFCQDCAPVSYRKIWLANIVASALPPLVDFWCSECPSLTHVCVAVRVWIAIIELSVDTDAFNASIDIVFYWTGRTSKLSLWSTFLWSITSSVSM